MRGRLIFPFLAELYRLDTRATATDPDAGYDLDFKEPVIHDEDHDGIGERTRREHRAVRIPCQVETRVFEELRMHAAGNVPRSRIDLVLHFKDLERMQLIDPASGDARIRPNDRLGAIYDKTGALVQAIRMPPGLYVTEARPIGFGLNRSCPRRNLLLLTFNERPLASRRSM